MALLFVGDAMNLAWIAALAALVLSEKALPQGNGSATALVSAQSRGACARGWTPRTTS